MRRLLPIRFIRPVGGSGWDGKVKWCGVQGRYQALIAPQTVSLILGPWQVSDKAMKRGLIFHSYASKAWTREKTYDSWVEERRLLWAEKNWLAGWGARGAST